MGESVERRSNDAIRVPLDTLIELSHEDFGDHFEADCVNLSARGLSMRASYLPEPGTRLSCSFQHPPSGEKISAQGEVVWAEDSGQRMGEFGVRFVQLDAKAERMIYEIVADVLASEKAPESKEIYTSARLELDGVASPVIARVVHAAKDLVTVEQELSFLKLGRGVSMRVGDSKEMRRGKIDGIDLSFKGDVPNLVLQVVYDEMPVASAPAPAQEETTLTDFEAPKFEAQQMDDIVGHAMPVITRTTTVSVAETTTTTTLGEAVVTKERDGVRVIRTEGEFDREVSAFKDKNSLGATIAAVWTALVAVCGPILAKFWAKTKEVAIEFGQKAGPVIADGSARTGRVIGHWVAIVRARAAEKFPALGSSDVRARGRRVTSPAPAMAQRPTKRVQGAAAVEVEDTKQGSKTLILAGVVVAAAVAAFFLFNRSEDDLGAVAANTQTAQRTTAPAAAAPNPATPVAAAPNPATPVATAPASPVVAQPAPVQVIPTMPQAVPAAMPAAPAPVAAAPVAVQTPTALPAPSYEAGRLPAPNFPSLRDAPRPAAPPATVPGNSPYAVDVRASNGATPAAVTPATAPTGLMTFGAPTLSGGLIYSLRMDGRILGITGNRARTTLSIRIAGARSLDRAAPIFARNPQVERAAIVNSVDHAELTIQFREGMAPNYRVVARGTTLEVMLSR
jgi:hypothetical protein